MLRLVAVLLASSSEELDGGIPGDAGVRLTTVVTSARGLDVRRVAGSAHIVTEEALERRELNDIHRVVAEVPGVYFREEDGLGLRPNIGLRGANPDRSAKVTLLEDGVLFAPSPYSAPAAYYFPLVTRMSSLEVFKGPASIRFGPQTIGGAVNLVTRAVPTHHLLFVDAAAGSRFVARVHAVAAAANERWGVLGEGVVLRDDGFKRIDGGGNAGFERAEVMVKARATPSLAWARQLELKGTFSIEDSRETYLGLADADFAAAPFRRYAASAGDRMQWQRFSGTASWSANPFDGVALSAVAYRHQFSRTWRRLDHFRRGPALYDVLARPVTGGLDAQYLAVLRGDVDSTGVDESLIVLRNAREFVSQGVQLTSTFEFTTGPLAHDVEAGARFHYDDIRRTHTASGFATVDGALVPDGLDEEVVTRNVGRSRAFSMHLQDTVTWGRLLVAPGARLEVIESAFVDALTGASLPGFNVVPLAGVGAVVALPHGLNAFAGVHQGFSPVTPGQDVDVRPERATHWELGLRLPRRGARFELVGFFSDYSTITGECTGSAGCFDDARNQQFNGGAARIMGLEVLASKTLALPHEVQLSPQGTYTLTEARFLNDFSSAKPIWGTVREGDFLPYVPVHQAAARLVATRNALSLSVGVEVNGAFLEEAGDGTRQPVVPTRVLVDATASYEIGPLVLYAQGTNLLNQSVVVARRPFGARSLAPLAIQGGVKVRWP